MSTSCSICIHILQNCCSRSTAILAPVVLLFSKTDFFPALYISLQCITVHYITLHYNTLNYITLHYFTLQYITLLYSTVQYSMLQYITVFLAVGNVSAGENCMENNYLIIFSIMAVKSSIQTGAPSLGN